MWTGVRVRLERMSPLLSPQRSDVPAASATASVPARPGSRFTKHRRDLRLYVGIGLVLISMLIGAKLVSSADSRVELWTAESDLSAGTVIRATDLRLTAVGVDDPSSYVQSSVSLVGKTLRRSIGAGELIGASAVADQPGQQHRLVTIAVDALHAPPGLARGERVDVYMTQSESSGASPVPLLMLSDVLVSDPGSADASGSGQFGVVVDVPIAQTVKAVEAARGGQVDIVRAGS